MAPLIYFDHAATTVPSPEAVAAAHAAMERTWGNPSSVHACGLAAQQQVRTARAAVAAALGARADEVIFTAGGTEADNLALRGAALALRRRGSHIVTTAVEHPAVLSTLEALEREGFTHTRVPVGADGAVRTEDVLAALRPETVLVSVMSVCNETGVRMPVEAIARAVKARRPDVLFHSDLVQSFLKERIALTNIDLASVSAHKVHGIKGCGALYVKKGLRLLAHTTGGGQEGGLRSGTEATPAIAAFGAAAAKGLSSLAENRRRVHALSVQARELLSAVPGVELAPVQSVDDILLLYLPGYKSEVVLRMLSDRGICLSAGSACRKGHRSPVLTAMGIDPRRIDGALRVSLGAENTPGELLALRDALCAATAELISL